MKADYAITMTGQIVVTAGTIARVVAEKRYQGRAVHTH